MLTLAACTTTPLPPPAPPPAGEAVIQREKSHWVPVDWSQLPGWREDRITEAWPALLRGCVRPAAGWQALCAQAQAAPAMDDAALREWLTRRLQPYRVQSPSGEPTGLATGYFEPTLTARRQATGSFRHPLWQPPADLARRQPHWTRQQLDTLPEAQASVRGREIAYLADPLDALLLQVQGSGRLVLDGGQMVRLAFAGHNGHTYKSVGRWLIEQGALSADGASWPAIKEWAQRNPGRVQEMLWANPRMVYFREEPLPDPQIGPRGSQGVPLTTGRSIAVDTASIPLGTPVWLDTTAPLSTAPLQRLVMAQDTGSAILGAVRADYFWGSAPDAEAQAGRMKQPLRMWVLWPRAGAL